MQQKAEEVTNVGPLFISNSIYYFFFYHVYLFLVLLQIISFFSCYYILMIKKVNPVTNETVLFHRLEGSYPTSPTSFLVHSDGYLYFGHSILTMISVMYKVIMLRTNGQNVTKFDEVTSMHSFTIFNFVVY